MARADYSKVQEPAADAVTVPASWLRSHGVDITQNSLVRRAKRGSLKSLPPYSDRNPTNRWMIDYASAVAMAAEMGVTLPPPPGAVNEEAQVLRLDNEWLNSQLSAERVQGLQAEIAQITADRDRLAQELEATKQSLVAALQMYQEHVVRSMAPMAVPPG